eukprot:Seg1224.2 transcript_id=Seg1224.2/GoldUCD/mRNA.D3Y31 product=Hemicentin-2 protein_id=Seg1224.2/GoldUCD/D3Y31
MGGKGKTTTQRNKTKKSYMPCEQTHLCAGLGLLRYLKNCDFTVFISVPLESASVNISVSHRNITVNGSLEVNLLGVDPISKSSTLSCSTVTGGGARYDIVYYNFFLNTLVLENPKPAEYDGRVQITSNRQFTVSPIKFIDEKLGVQCKMTYFNKVGTRFTVQSNSIIIENVYAFPVISGNHIQGSFTAIKGTPTEVTCSVRSRPASTITWSAETGVIGIPETPTVQQDGFYYITKGRYNLSNPVYAMDGKKINCTGIPVFGSAVTIVTTLNVLYRPENTTFTVTPSKLVLNTTIKLTCAAKGLPSVRNYGLYVNGKLIGNQTDGNLTVNLSPSNCAKYFGEYKCVPESIIGEGESKTTTREFELESSVTLTPSKIANEGENVTLSCSAKVCPTSDIMWKKNGNTLEGKTGNRLQLLSVTIDDTGEYSCHATFWKTTKSAKMNLTMNHKPRSIQFTTLTLKPQNGNAVRLSCSSKAFPAPSYRIYKITGSSSTLISNRDSYSIPSINYVDYNGYKAIFRCEAFNIFGNTTKDIQLDIQVKPILAVSSDKQVTKGSNVTFGCNITAANPSTKMITWKSPMNELIKHSNGVVMMSSVSAKQGGRYICLASNRAGESNKAFTLTIEDKPGAIRTNQSSKAGIISSVIGGLMIVIGA